MPSFEGIERSQKKLFRNIQNELALLDGGSREIAAYEKAFYSGLPRKVKLSTKSELLRVIKKSRVILVGDFHSFRQSQKGFLRILKESVGKNHAAIGLECVQQAHQAALDEFLSGLITLDELRDKIEFEKYWPFSWSNYREILEYAREKKFKVIALNIPEQKRNTQMLRQRDKAAAERISSILSEKPSLQVFCLYGELHLGRRHLPADLKSLLGKQKTVLCIHQNIPSLYWKVSKQVNSQKTEILRLEPQEFCLLNSVPWVKLRSYLDWLEGNPEGHDWREDNLDIAGVVQQYAELLGETIGLRSDLKSDFNIYSSEQIEDYKPKNLSKDEKYLLKHAQEFHRTSYLAGTGSLILPVTSTNALSEGAALLLWRSQLSRSSKPIPAFGPPLLVQFLIGYLGSKILNPKRKCNEEKDLLFFAMPNAKKSSFELAKQRIFSRSLTILRSTLKNKPLEKKQLRNIEEIEATRLAAYILGDRLFLTLLRDPSQIDFIRRIFSASASSHLWASHLLTEIVSCLSSHQIEPKRKTEKF